MTPLSVLGSWDREIEKWDRFSDITITTLHGKDKDKNIHDDVNVYMINYEGLEWLAKKCNELKSFKFNCIIYDESTKLKSYSSKRFKICKQLTKLVDRTIIMSGIPSPNGYMDLYSQYYLLDEGKRLGRTITQYRENHFYQIGDRRFNNYILKNHHDLYISNAISDITYRIDDKDLPKLKKLKDNLITIDINDTTYKKYKKLSKDSLLELQEETITTQGASSLLNKLRQLSSGFLYNDNEVIKVHDLKIKRLLEVLEQLDTNVIIAYNYKYELELILDSLKSSNKVVKRIGSGTTSKETNDLVNLWNKKKIDILICNPASVSHGLNLQQGGNNIIWYSLIYNYEHYHQLIGRLHRQGQKNEVTNHVLILDKTIDIKIYNKLQDKKMTQNEFLDNILSDIEK